MDTQIPEKLYFKIGEVAEIAGVKTHVLRYWESEFNMIKPNKSRSNQRLYRRKDIELILKLKDLLYNQGFTISGARKKLREKPTQPEAAASPSKPETDQLSLPLNSWTDQKLLQEIREDLLRLRRSLETSP